MFVQSVIMNKQINTLQQAIAWLKKHGYNIRKIGETNKYWRFRIVTHNIQKSYHFSTKLINKYKQIYLIYEYNH